MSLFEPDVLNEAAFPLNARRPITPERRLLIAIFADAVDCYQKNLGARSARGRRLCRDAERWILSDDQAWVFSFRNICDALGVDAAAMRERARAWKTDHAAHARASLNPKSVLREPQHKRNKSHFDEETEALSARPEELPSFGGVSKACSRQDRQSLTMPDRDEARLNLRSGCIV